MKQTCFEVIRSKVNASGIIEGVSVITMGEAKGHGVFIDEKSLELFAALGSEADAVRVKFEHGGGLKDVVGTLRNFRVESPQVRADLHLLKTHSQFATITEMADHLAGEFGLSVAFNGTREELNGKDYVRPTELYSVDLVDQPAANPDGLFNRAFTFAPLADRQTIMNNESLYEKIVGLFAKAEKAESLSAVQMEVTQLKAQLEAKDGNISTLTQELASAQAKATENDAAHVIALAAKDAEVETKVAMKVAALVASVGAPPVDSSNGSIQTLTAQLEAITDPAKKVVFYNKNKRALINERDGVNKPAK